MVLLVLVLVAAIVSSFVVDFEVFESMVDQYYPVQVVVVAVAAFDVAEIVEKLAAVVAVVHVGDSILDETDYYSQEYEYRWKKLHAEELDQVREHESES
jgi:hypothetical protein